MSGSGLLLTMVVGRGRSGSLWTFGDPRFQLAPIGPGYGEMLYLTRRILSPRVAHV